MRKSTRSRVMTRSTALAASGTEVISFESARTSSTISLRPPTAMPPPLLMSSIAMVAPAQWFSPWTKAMGPRIAILTVPCPDASGASASAATIRIERNIAPSF